MQRALVPRYPKGPTSKAGEACSWAGEGCPSYNECPSLHKMVGLQLPYPLYPHTTVYSTSFPILSPPKGTLPQTTTSPKPCFFPPPLHQRRLPSAPLLAPSDAKHSTAHHHPGHSLLINQLLQATHAEGRPPEVIHLRTQHRTAQRSRHVMHNSTRAFKGQHMQTYIGRREKRLGIPPTVSSCALGLDSVPFMCAPPPPAPPV
jgi:hypothetical protein